MTIENIKKRVYPEITKKTTIDIPEGKWLKCPKCKEIIYRHTFDKNMSICPYCNNYFRLTCKERLEQIADKDTFNEFDLKIETANPLDILEYPEKIKREQKKNNLKEAIICGTCFINGEECVLEIMDSNFFMGSMGSVLGEYITYGIEESIRKRLPLIIFSTSGGARMQEGIISLMQMAKTTNAIARHNEEGLLYISVITDPTYGGVTASFATLGDIIISEPGTMIGFAGPNVIKQTIGEELPVGFQTSEFQLDHGFLDLVVERKNMKDTLSNLIKLHKGSGING